MNVHLNDTAGRSCDRCGNLGYVPDNGIITNIGEPVLRECECSALRSIARAMPVYVRAAPVSELHLALYHESRLADIVERPGHRSRFVLLHGTQANTNAVMKLVHVRGQWRSQEQVQYVTDKALTDARYRSFDAGADEGESPYEAAQSLLARTKLLVITAGVAQSKSAQTALLEAVQLRLQADADCWLVSPDEIPVERSLAFSPELQLALGRFKPVRVGAAATPAVRTEVAAPRTTVAKYPGVCAECQAPFRAGDMVAWTKASGGKRVHPSCARS